jgi:succinyl-diaminopimelate desuccinylase
MALACSATACSLSGLPVPALRGALLGAVGAAGLSTTAKVAGPFNIGNYLAGLGIPATAGFTL